jgi:hypothetical protein
MVTASDPAAQMLPVFSRRGPVTPIHLTAPNPELDRLARRTPEGMMFWSGTSADPSATCGVCEHFGYDYVVRNAAGNAIGTKKFPQSCALYKKYTGKDGKAFSGKTAACKYYQAKQS